MIVFIITFKRFLVPLKTSFPVFLGRKKNTYFQHLFFYILNSMKPRMSFVNHNFYKSIFYLKKYSTRPTFRIYLNEIKEIF